MNASSLQSDIFACDAQASVLWEKLRGLSLDGSVGSKSFAARLAGEQRWSDAFTRRAIEEYRRFLLLFALEQRREKAAPTLTGGPGATRIVPSAIVDKVWHLHLLYTQSYWEDLCRDVLGEPLHHQPANGSAGEAGALDEVYRANMEAYRTTFGELAPSDIWPASKGVPLPGTPLAEILETATPPSRLVNQALLLTMGVPVLFIIVALFVGWQPSNPGALMGTLVMTGGGVIAVCACVGLFVGLIHRSERPRRRCSLGTDGGEGFFCGGSGGGDSSGYDGHSHDSHGGHSDSGGGHSCGGHSCGGHGCGGH